MFNSLLVEEDADLSLEYVIHPIVGVHALIKSICLVIVHCPVAHVLKEESDWFLGVKQEMSRLQNVIVIWWFWEIVLINEELPLCRILNDSELWLPKVVLIGILYTEVISLRVESLISVLIRNDLNLAEGCVQTDLFLQKIVENIF